MTSWISRKQTRNIIQNQTFVNNDYISSNIPPTSSYAPPTSSYAPPISQYAPQLSRRQLNNKPTPEIPLNVNYNDFYVLKNKIDTITFVILKHTRSESDFEFFKRAYFSVKTLYPKNKVVVIDDNSPYPASIDLVDDDILIESEFPGAGEILPYYYFLRFQWSENMIFLQDSMMIVRHFNLSEISHNIKFFWEFNNDDGYNSIIENNITSLINNINKNEAPILLIKLSSKFWKGCFGSTTLISLDIVKSIELKYNIFTKLTTIINKRIQREALERLLSLIFFNENLVDINNCSMFGNIQSYPFAFKSTSPLDLQKYNYNSAINKVWLGR